MRREETIPEKTKKVVAEVTETEEPARDIPEGGRTFTEHVSEYLGRLWGSAKSLVGRKAEATGQKTDEAKSYGSRNVEDTKEAFAGTSDSAKGNKEAIVEGAKDAKDEIVELGKDVKEGVAGGK